MTKNVDFQCVFFCKKNTLQELDTDYFALRLPDKILTIQMLSNDQSDLKPEYTHSLLSYKVEF